MTTTGGDRGRPTVLDLLAPFVSLALLAAGLWRHRHFFHDDAYISLRYAMNLVRHGELAWNPGEPVEGYTNFLHLLSTAGLLRLGVPPEAAVQALNLAGAVALIGLTWQAARIVAPGTAHAPERAAAVIAVGATPAVAVWVLGGLEAVPLAALLAVGLTGTLILARDARNPVAIAVTAIAFSLAVLTRMDASVFITGSGLGLLLAGRERLRARLVAAALIVAVPGAVSLLHMAWRYDTYGALLPLTFYAKAGLPLAERIAELPRYFLASVDWAPLVTLGALGVLAGLVFRRRGPGFAVLAAAFCAHLAFVVWSGGDHMKGSRVLVVLVAPAALILLTLSRDAGRLTGRAVMAGAALASAGALYLRPPLDMDPAAHVGTLVGRYIDEAWPEGSLVAVHTAGATPFHAPELRFLDMLGLNDPVIAAREDVPRRAVLQFLAGHMKGDGAYVLSREPDYIIAGLAEGSPVEDHYFLNDVELSELPEFARCYALKQARIPYSERYAARGEVRPNPLVFTYYERVCP